MTLLPRMVTGIGLIIASCVAGCVPNLAGVRVSQTDQEIAIVLHERFTVGMPSEGVEDQASALGLEHSWHRESDGPRAGRVTIDAPLHGSWAPLVGFFPIWPGTLRFHLDGDARLEAIALSRRVEGSAGFETVIAELFP